MPKRNVVVVMPFGAKGRDDNEKEIGRRRAILNFKRIEHLIGQCKVTAATMTGGTEPIDYDVRVARTTMDDIPDRALQQIEAADVLIALFTEHNPNVIYEVAYRRTRDRTVVLVVDEVEVLPLYVNSLGRQIWRQAEVLARIDMIAKDLGRDLPSFDVAIPEDLKKVIDDSDSALNSGLQDALFEIEKTIKPRVSEAVAHLRGIVSDRTVTFYPNSIVEVPFSARGTFDTNRPAIVVEFDETFSHLYGYPNKQAAENDRPLTLAKLLERIETFSDHKDWTLFMKDQTELTKVLKDYSFARAKEPLRINEQHGRREYRGTSYLPCVIAQVIEGSPDASHSMYLLVTYIEMPNCPTPPASAAS
jgi:hypothetical protein